jgi:hypothetical protein
MCMCQCECVCVKERELEREREREKEKERLHRKEKRGGQQTRDYKEENVGTCVRVCRWNRKREGER